MLQNEAKGYKCSNPYIKAARQISDEVLLVVI